MTKWDLLKINPPLQIAYCNRWVGGPTWSLYGVKVCLNKPFIYFSDFSTTVHNNVLRMVFLVGCGGESELSKFHMKPVLMKNGHGGLMWHASHSCCIQVCIQVLGSGRIKRTLEETNHMLGCCQGNLVNPNHNRSGYLFINIRSWELSSI